MNVKQLMQDLQTLRKRSETVADHVKAQIAESDLIDVAVNAVASGNTEELQAAMEELFLMNNMEFEDFYRAAFDHAERYATAEVLRVGSHHS